MPLLFTGIKPDTSIGIIIILKVVLREWEANTAAIGSKLTLK